MHSLQMLTSLPVGSEVPQRAHSLDCRCVKQPSILETLFEFFHTAWSNNRIEAKSFSLLEVISSAAALQDGIPKQTFCRAGCQGRLHSAQYSMSLGASHFSTQLLPSYSGSCGSGFCLFSRYRRACLDLVSMNVYVFRKIAAKDAGRYFFPALLLGQFPGCMCAALQ